MMSFVFLKDVRRREDGLGTGLRRKTEREVESLCEWSR